MKKNNVLFVLLFIPTVSFAQQTKDTAIVHPEHPAEFPGGTKEWVSYLIHHLNRALGYQYLTVAKGAKNAKQTVALLFEIDTAGHTTHIIVENLREVHPELAKEGIRIITASPVWKPASQDGKPVTDKRRQNITFVSGSIF
ncbi:MAG: hypothetical protein V4450_07740 [Bacteroidota bacterium]